MREKYDSKIIIRKGAEFGLQAHVKKETDDFYANGSFDFVIGSTHCVKGLELYGNSFYQGKTQHDAYLEYFEEKVNFPDFLKKIIFTYKKIFGKITKITKDKGEVWLIPENNSKFKKSVIKNLKI